MEDIEYNPFFIALQTEFNQLFEDCQAKGHTVFIPVSHSLTNISINKEFASVHIAKPSPFFKGEYTVNDGRFSMDLRIEDGIVQRSNDFLETSDVIILGEETGYSKDGKSYSIYLINKPLQTYGTKVLCGNELKETTVSQNWLDGSECPSINQCKSFIRNFDNGFILTELDNNLDILLKNYLFLSEYLVEIAEKLRKLIDSTIENICERNHSLGPKTITALPICIECYVMSAVNSALFPIICNRFEEEDKTLSSKLSQLHSAGVTPFQLGALEVFSCPAPASVVELARLPSLTTPREQLQCVKNTIDLISAEIKQHLLESRGFLSFTGELPCVTADDLIPALSSIIIKSKPSHLSAHLYLMDKFAWSVSSKDIYGYGLTSFKAAIEFLKTLDSHQLSSSTTDLKKDLSLEELMEATVKLDDNNRSENRGQKSSNSVDKQMEKITRMIEASTRELSQVQHQGF